MDFEKYLETINLLNRASTAYYRDDSPFMSDAEYDKLLAEDAFYETVNSQYGGRYGTLRSEVDSFLNVGQDVIFDMDWVGLKQVKSKAPHDVVSIYMLPPSIKELRRRLEGRHTAMNAKRTGLIRASRNDAASTFVAHNDWLSC